MMGMDHDPGTVTLAQVFAEQGHWEKSVEIYRNLLRKDPDRPDVAQALAAAEAALRAAKPASSQALVPLFQEWIELLLTYDRLRQLRRFKARLTNAGKQTGAASADVRRSGVAAAGRRPFFR
jgi:predicted Zn-dependent protease